MKSQQEATQCQNKFKQLEKCGKLFYGDKILTCRYSDPVGRTVLSILILKKAVYCCSNRCTQLVLVLLGHLPTHKPNLMSMYSSSCYIAVSFLNIMHWYNMLIARVLRQLIKTGKAKLSVWLSNTVWRWVGPRGLNAGLRILFTWAPDAREWPFTFMVRALCYGVAQVADRTTKRKQKPSRPARGQAL
jgi:hypothetical protein